MKQLVVITAEELRDAALYLLRLKPAFNGKHVAAVEFVFDRDDPNPARQIRAEVVLFDTARAARAYTQGDPTPDDQRGSTESIAHKVGELLPPDGEGVQLPSVRPDSHPQPAGEPAAAPALDGAASLEGEKRG